MDSATSPLKRAENGMMRTGKRFIQILSFILICFLSSPALSADLPIDRFCDIYGDTVPKRLDKIIRLFRLAYRPWEQLKGDATCPKGEKFRLNTSCVGDLRVAVFSLSDPKSATMPNKASTLFHLYSKKDEQSDFELTKCLPPS